MGWVKIFTPYGRFTPAERFPVAIEYETRWATDSVRTLRRKKKKFLSSQGIELPLCFLYLHRQYVCEEFKEAEVSVITTVTPVNDVCGHYGQT
jgi:hypothetical protein